MEWIVLAAYIATVLLSMWAIAYATKADFGRVNRGDIVLILFISLMPVANFILAGVIFASCGSESRWTKFWGHKVW